MNAYRLRIGCLLLMVAVFAPLANANPVPGNDPRIIINDPDCPYTAITTQSFTFTADANGMGVLCFRNASGVAWDNLSINVIQPPNTTFPTDFSCQSDIWASCVFTLNGNILNIFFSGGSLPDDGTQFTIDLTSESTTGWGSNAQFSTTANVPEPGTLSLFLAGLGTLVARRRLRTAA